MSDEKLPVPPKAKKCKYRCIHSAGTSVSENYSPQVQKPMSTDIKGGSIHSPPKPTINMVPKKDVAEGDTTTCWDSKDYH